ncbi:uncharacterized protein LOC100199661 isoform X2 [Hydra vulgaris]|uniref:Uncharacterized protein LOC100199661 isoform X2 n=1 Tax=Hydra vulgaris TaxID=6087 RepID=A0ABM4B637_HYDVU
MLILVIVLTLHFFGKLEAANSFERRNIVLATNFDSSNSFGKLLVSDLLSKLPLDKYRVSLYSTNGVFQQFFDFQSRACLLKVLSNKQPKQTSLTNALKQAMQEIESSFNDEKHFFVIVTDTFLDESTVEFLKSIHRSSLNEGIYILQIGKVIQTYFRKEDGFSWISINSTTIINNLPFIQANRQSCSKNYLLQLDECSRRCDCVDGKLVNCRRVRREFSSMSREERDLYLNTIKEFSVNPKYVQTYEKFIMLHQKYFWSGIHEAKQFYPWHRSYILKFESLLRVIDCRVTLPFWNWAYFSNSVWKSTPTHHMWDIYGGFGGDGAKSIGYCVTEGIFSLNNWKTSKFEDRKTVILETCRVNQEESSESVKCIETANIPFLNKCLRRRFNGNVPNISSIFHVINNLLPNEFPSFERVVRNNWHNTIHKAIGGHMGTEYASYSPEFWSHHAMLDGLWFEWQKKCAKCVYSGYPGKSEYLIGSKQYRHDYINSLKLGECGIKVVYDPIFVTN